MRLSVYLPRVALYWAAKLNGASVGNGPDYWEAPVLTVVAMSAADQQAMDDVIESFRYWAETYRPPSRESERPNAPSLDAMTAEVQRITVEIQKANETLLAVQACESLCRRPYPQE